MFLPLVWSDTQCLEIRELFKSSMPWSWSFMRSFLKYECIENSWSMPNNKMNNISTHTTWIMIYLVFFSCFWVMPPTLILLRLHSLLSGTFYIYLWTKALLEMTKPLSSLRDCNSVLNMMPQEDSLVTLYSKRDLDIGWPSVLLPIRYLASETLINCVFACAFT